MRRNRTLNPGRIRDFAAAPGVRVEIGGGARIRRSAVSGTVENVRGAKWRDSLRIAGRESFWKETPFAAER